jgi:S-adenosylmethionine-diacylglycerol 3-amino-3-carboxypropyl transferase
MSQVMNKQLTDQVNFKFIRYANCWEDADLLLQGLQIKEGDNILSIASAGDNSFAFLAINNVTVHAVDVNEIQLYLCEFKKIAIKYLDYNLYLQLLGYKNCVDRLSIYDSIKNYMSSETVAWCKLHIDDIESGIIYSGKFEKYFYKFRKYILPLVHTQKTIDNLFLEKSEQEQLEFYNTKFNTWRWRFLFKIFFSKFIMGRFGRDPQFLKQVNISVGDFIFNKAANHLSNKDCQKNYFLYFIFTGKFNLNNLPYYVRENNYNNIKQNIDNINFHKGYVQEIAEAKPNFFTHANLSNIFEYMDENIFENIANSLNKSMVQNAKLSYWNLMAERVLALTFSNNFKQTIIPNLKTDNGFFYKSFNTNIKL